MPDLWITLSTASDDVVNVQRDCADLPRLQGEVIARAAKAGAALEADGDVVDDDEVGDAD